MYGPRPQLAQRQVYTVLDPETMTDRATCPFCGEVTVVDWPSPDGQRGFPRIVKTCQHEGAGMVVAGARNRPTIFFKGPAEALEEYDAR